MEARKSEKKQEKEIYVYMYLKPFQATTHHQIRPAAARKTKEEGRVLSSGHGSEEGARGREMKSQFAKKMSFRGNK